MGPGAGLDGCGKCRPHRDSIPGPSMNFAISNNGSEMPPKIYDLSCGRGGAVCHARPWLYVACLPVLATGCVIGCGTALSLADNTVYGRTVRENEVVNCVQNGGHILMPMPSNFVNNCGQFIREFLSF